MANDNESPSSIRSRYPFGLSTQGRRLLPSLRRDRNPSEAKYSSLSFLRLLSGYFAKGDKKKHNLVSNFLITLLLASLLALSATASYLLLDILGIQLPIRSDLINTIKLPKLYLVQSGSMEPAIKTASIVVTLPSETYSQGEVITFQAGGHSRPEAFSKGGKNIVTHRIQAKLYPSGATSPPIYKTAGDANEDFDNWDVANSDIIGKVVFSVPYIGYVADFAKKPQGFILLVIIPATIIIYEELKSILKESKSVLKRFFSHFKGQSLHASLPAQAGRTMSIGIDEQNQKSFPKVSILLPILGALLVFAGLATSYFLDKEESLGNVFSAADTFVEASPTLTPSPLPSISVTPSPTPTSGPGDVVINEINWVGSNGDGNDEWVELRNTTSNSIDLTNWLVEELGTGDGASITIPSGTIPANGFFLISNSDKTGSRVNVDPELVTTSVSLNNGGEQLVLKNSAAVTIDTANGTGAWFAGSNSTPKKSMERISPPGDGTQSTNWQTATTHINMDGSGSTDEFATPKAVNGL